MKVLYLTNIPSPYVVDFLNELGKYCRLTAVFEKAYSLERHESWKDYKFQNFTGIILHGIPLDVDKALSPAVISRIAKGEFDHILVANPCTPTGILALEFMKLKKIPYMIESEGGFAKSGKGIKELLKKHILSGARLYFSTCPTGDEYFLKYGAVKEKIVRFPFTTQYREDIALSPPTREEKQAAKERIHYKQEKMILSIGSFIPRKGFDILLKACRNLPESAGVCMIGGTPDENYMELKRQVKNGHVFFYHHLSKPELKDFFLAADIFVLATRYDTWGLVIPEAMSQGLPVISTHQCVAALGLIKDHENGWIVPSENDKILEDRIHFLLGRPELCQSMAENNIQKMKNYTIEEMAGKHLEIFHILKGRQAK